MVDFAQARQTMVDCQVRPADVTDLRVIAALGDVARERFVPAASRAVAYLDRDVPLGGGRALLKPMVFAKLLQAAGLNGTERVLDVGCGTGYSAAVLADLAASVVALEEDAEVAGNALSGIHKVTSVRGPLADGWQQGAPYDVIMMQGATEVAPDSLLAQLADGGRLLTIVGSGPVGKATIYRASGKNVTAQPLFDAAAPLLPGFAKAPAFVF
jgi:protein-L-isoaspartate(D-aspartate) O-methyltransferase